MKALLLRENIKAQERAGSIPLGSVGLLASPLDFLHFFISVPPISAEHICGIVRNELRFHYPGGPGATASDWLSSDGATQIPPNGGGPIIAIATPKDVLEDWKKYNLPLVFGISLLSRARRDPPPSENDVRVLIAPSWFEVAVFSKGHCIEHEAHPFPDALADETVKRKIESVSAKDLLVMSVGVPESDMAELRARFQSANTRTVEATIDGVLPFITPLKPALFTEKGNRKSILARHSIEILVLLNLLSIGFFFQSSATAKEEKARRIRREYESRKNEIVRIESLLAEIKSIEKAVEAGESSLFPDPYSVLSEIQGRLLGSWLRSMTLRDGAFQFEAEGGDALAVFNAFKASPMFTDIQLHQSSRSEVKGELFTISGGIRAINQGK